jgi:hypothetical protein
MGGLVLMAGRVVEERQIRINNVLFSTSGRVREFLASQSPAKLTLGDYSDASNPFASEWSFEDGRGGIGIEVLDPRKDLDRVWYSTAQLRYPGRVVLPRLSTLTAALPASADIEELREFKNEMYACQSTGVYVYNNGTDSWGSSVRTLEDEATDSAVGLLHPGGVATLTLVIATGSDVDYATNSSTWNRNTLDIKFVYFWNNLLWGMDVDGQLYYTDDLSTGWTKDAQLQLPSGYVNSLLVARGADNLEHLYAATTIGLWIHNTVEGIWEETDMSELPYHSDGGVGTTKWRGNIFYPAGNAVYRFQPRSGGTVVDTVGPDLDYGLPQDKRGVIKKLTSTHNDLIAFLDASVVGRGTSGVQTRVSRGARFHHGLTLSAQLGYSIILGWNEDGWEVKWESGAADKPITTGTVANSYNSNRLWWASNQRIYYQNLPVDTVNPLQVPDTTYAATATLETPWNDFRTRNATKLALSFLLDTVNPSSSETVKVEYAVNNIESYTTILTQASTGESETTFPIGGANAIGLSFKSIKFRVTLARGSEIKTPQLVKMTLVWRQRNKELIGVQANVLLGDDASPEAKTQLVDLKTALLKDDLFEVTYRNDDGNTQNYYMEIVNFDAQVETGENHNGTVQLIMVEPRQTTAR